MHQLIRKSDGEVVAVQDGEIKYSRPHGAWQFDAGSVADRDGTAFRVNCMIIPVEDFIQLFTSAERVSLRDEAAKVPGDVGYNATLDDYWRLLFDNRRDEANLGKPFVIAAVNWLEASGYIDPGRSAEILSNTPPTP